MKTYIECFKDGIVVKRYDVTSISSSGREIIKQSQEEAGFQTLTINREHKLQTGWL